MNIKLIVFTTLLFAFNSSYAQMQVSKPSLNGSWEGSMMMGREDMTLALTFATVNGQVEARLTSAALGIYGLPADELTIADNVIKAVFKPIGAEFTGKLRLAESGVDVLRVDGDWFQSAEMIPLSLLPVSQPSF